MSLCLNDAYTYIYYKYGFFNEVSDFVALGTCAKKLRKKYNKN